MKNQDENRKIPIWWEAKRLYKKDMNEYIRIIEKEAEKKEKALKQEKVMIYLLKKKIK